MRRILIALMLALNISGAISQNTNAEQIDFDKYANLLDDCMNNENYESGLEFVKILSHADSLSPNALENCCQCFIMLGKYQDCLNFYETWISSHPNDDFVFFLRNRAFCYYSTDRPEEAAELYGAYIKYYDEAKRSVGASSLSIYASSLYKAHNYENAEEAFARYFSTVAAEESMEMDKLYTAKDKNYYGRKFYEYAYTCFFQGKEQKGFQLLTLSKLCGNESAIEDYDALILCSSFNKEVKYKSKTLSDFDKYITQFDIYPNLAQKDPYKFWEQIQKENVQLNTLLSSLNGKVPGTLKKAFSQLQKVKPNLELMLRDCSPFEVSEIEPSMDKSLCGDNSFLKELRIFHADQANAFATPFGQIYLTDKIITDLHFNNDLLLGICAHEATHYICQHSLVSLWQEAKKEKKNKIAAAISVGLNSAAQAAGSFMMASSGVKVDDDYWDSYWSNVATINDNLLYSFNKNTYYFQFKYGRTNEIEADIIAYRFCEAMGIGGYSYIMGLQLLGDNSYSMKAEKDSDHPTTEFRIGLLKHLYAKEHPDYKLAETQK